MIYTDELIDAMSKSKLPGFADKIRNLSTKVDGGFEVSPTIVEQLEKDYAKPEQTYGILLQQSAGKCQGCGN